MKRKFVNTRVFDRDWEGLGLSDIELRSLQDTILDDPKAAAVIQGTGGLRKLRFSVLNRGKSGSIRVIYIDVEEFGVTFLITAYAKNQADDLTEKEKAIFKELSGQLKNALKGGKK